MINVLPNYGRAKGQPIDTATLQDLEYYRGGCISTIGNPDKAPWHAIERERLVAIEQEIARRNQRQPPPQQQQPAPGAGIQSYRPTCPHCGAMIALIIQR